MVKLKGQERIFLILFTLWYLISIQFVSQELVALEDSVISENNIFKSKEIMLVFLNGVIIFFSIFFLMFQGFVYRFIMLLFKCERYPSLFASFYYLVIGYLPVALTIIAIKYLYPSILYDFTTSIYFKLATSVVVNVIYNVIIVKKQMIELKKAIVLGAFLTLMNFLVLLVQL